MNLYQPESIWDVGAELGEGALWHAASRSVYFVDVKGRRLHRCAPDGSSRRGSCDMLVADDELARRRLEPLPPVPPSQTPWQQLYRATVGQLETGACMEMALPYRGVGHDMSRHNH